MCAFSSNHVNHERSSAPKQAHTSLSFPLYSLGLAGFLMIIIIIEKRTTFSQSQYGGSAAVVLFLLFQPIALVIRDEYRFWKSKREAMKNDLSPSLHRQTIFGKVPVLDWG